MPQQIRRFGIGQTAKVVGLLYTIVGLVFVPIFLLVAIYAPQEDGFSIGLAIALPLLYGLMGFVVTAIGCAFYNLVAGWVGGIEVELDVTQAGA